MLKLSLIVYPYLFFIITSVLLKSTECFIIRLLTETLENNVAGEPITHQRTDWDFDPEAGKNQRNLFYEIYGFRGAKLIEHLGLGRDGKDHERRALQHQRDIHRLNGEHNNNYS